MAIKVGIAGKRGICFLQGLRGIEDVQVEAFCDIDEDVLTAEASKHGISHTYRVFEDMLASDIDAVIIATPMQLHVQQVLAALDAGKHVLSEVPAGTTMDEMYWLVEAVEHSGKVYMMAENYFYIPENQLIMNMVRGGVFGDVYFGEGEYLHNIKSIVHKNVGGVNLWRNYWQLGLRGMFYPTHSAGPVMKWFEGDRVKSLCCMGAGHHTQPSFRQEDTTITLCQMESGKMVKLRLDCLSERPHNMSYYSLQGTKGCYEAPRGLGDDHKIWLTGMDKDTDSASWRPLKDFWDEYMPERYKHATEEQRSAGHWGGDFFIVEDFINAVKGKAAPTVDVYEACEWSSIAMLSALSLMNGSKVVDMPDFRKQKRYVDQNVKI